MMVFVFAHRHNKDDRFLKETESELNEDLHLDFTIVRGVMYHYSKKAQERFFTFPIESFFMAMFAALPDG